MNEALQVIQRGEVEVGGARDTGGGMLVDAAASAAAAKSQAMVNAHFLMAIRNPRDWMDVRAKMLGACKRTRFADVSRYSIPRGGKQIEGWTIRFAEEVIRNMRNVMPESSIVGEDDDKRIVKVQLIDLEANIPYSTEFVLHKVIERKTLKDGETPIRTRINSQGKMLYILPAPDDELLVKQAAMVSKALRTLALRLMPGDILDECLDEVEATAKSDIERDPKAAAKKIADAFDSLNIKPSDLKSYLKHDLDASTPAELDGLRKLYQALKSGETTWREVTAEEGGEATGVPAQTANLKDKVAAKAGKKPADAGAPSAAEQADIAAREKAESEAAKK